MTKQNCTLNMDALLKYALQSCGEYFLVAGMIAAFITAILLLRLLLRRHTNDVTPASILAESYEKAGTAPFLYINNRRYTIMYLKILESRTSQCRQVAILCAGFSLAYVVDYLWVAVEDNSFFTPGKFFIYYFLPEFLLFFIIAATAMENKCYFYLYSEGTMGNKPPPFMLGKVVGLRNVAKAGLMTCLSSWNNCGVFYTFFITFMFVFIPCFFSVDQLYDVRTDKNDVSAYTHTFMPSTDGRYLRCNSYAHFFRFDSSLAEKDQRGFDLYEWLPSADDYDVIIIDKNSYAQDEGR